jgi:antitoxin Phd
MEWRLADAKNRFTELVNLALNSEPQIVKRRNDTVMVISQADYVRLTQKNPSFKEHLFNVPCSLNDIVHTRDTSPMRHVNL